MATTTNSSASICGIDIGTENCYVAVARQGGIEILLNEYSQRSTPAYIAFGGNQRELGVSAKQKQMMNLSNTCFAPISIIGKKFKDLNLAEIPYSVEENELGEVSVRVFHNGEELHLTATQVLAMLFTKLRQISGNPVDCVINCPNYFTDTQRRALIDAAVIAGLNPLKIISDMTAVALYYGFYRSSSAAQEYSIVGFVDCGQTSTQASVVLFNHKENLLKVLDAEYQENVGGKHFDQVLANYFIQKHNLQLNKRARYRLIAECEKLKKQMSANSNELPINIECLYDDRDFTGRIDRATFEQLAGELLEKINSMFQDTFRRAEEKFNKEFAEKYGKFRIDSVEVVGGTSRIPSIKRMIKEVFGVEPSTTLNADEAVARGCALQCAILSPTFKVAKELQMADSLPFQVDFRYNFGNNDFKSVRALYPRGHQYPFTKQISISSQTLPIATAFDYVADNGQVVPFAQFNIEEPANSNAAQYLQTSPIKLRVRIDSSGLISISSASVSYEKGEPQAEEPMDQSQNEGENVQKMETDEAPAATNDKGAQQQPAEEPKRKSKPKTVSIELNVNPVFILGKTPRDLMQKFIEFEANMVLADKNWKEKADARNTLEEFIYEWRDRLDGGGFDVFIDPNHKAEFQKLISDNEKWLFEQDENEIMHSRSVYEEKTNSMRSAFANAITNRKREFENRPRVLEHYGHRLQMGRKLTENIDPEEQEELNKFVTELDAKQKWFEEISGQFTTMNTFDDPPVKCDEINKQISELDSFINRIQNSRKRRADERKKAAEAAKKKEEEEAKKQQQQQQQAAGDNTENPAQPDAATMEVDEQQVPTEATA